MKERERNIRVWLPPTRPLLGTWPETQAWAQDWELNWQPFDLQAGAQSTEPHQPKFIGFKCKFSYYSSVVKLMDPEGENWH